MIKKLTLEVPAEDIKSLKRLALDRGLTLQKFMGGVIESVIAQGRRQPVVAPIGAKPATQPAPAAEKPDLDAAERAFNAAVAAEARRRPVAKVCGSCGEESALKSADCSGCGEGFEITEGGKVRMSDGTFDEIENWEGV